MEVITTHLNADFDAFASMIAAQKIYPKAVLAFPGSQEKSLRDFFLSSALYAFKWKKLKDIDLKKVTRLILVEQNNHYGGIHSSPNHSDGIGPWWFLCLASLRVDPYLCSNPTL